MKVFPSLFIFVVAGLLAPDVPGLFAADGHDHAVNHDTAESGHDSEDSGHDHAAAPRHDHAADHGNQGGSDLQRLGAFLGRFHVVAVHLPIGLLSFAVLFELIGWWRGQIVWSTVSRFNFVAGALTALLAAPLGWLAAADGASYPDDLQGYLEWHRWLGTSTAALGALGLVVLAIERRRATFPPRVYRTVILATALAVPVTGHLGGSLVHGPGHLFPATDESHAEHDHAEAGGHTHP